MNVCLLQVSKSRDRKILIFLFFFLCLKFQLTNFFFQQKYINSLSFLLSYINFSSFYILISLIYGRFFGGDSVFNDSGHGHKILDCGVIRLLEFDSFIGDEKMGRGL